MPCTVSHERHGIYAKFSGIVRAEDMAALTDALGSPNCFNYFYRITDFLGIDEFQINGVHLAHIRSLEYLFELTSPRMVRITVATDRAIVEAFQKEQTLRNSPDRSLLFSTLEAARHWIKTHIVDI